MYHFVEDPSTVAPYGGYIRGWSNQLVVYNKNTNRSDERFVNSYCFISQPQTRILSNLRLPYEMASLCLKLILITLFPFKLVLKWISGHHLVPPCPRWEWPLTTGAPPSPRAAHSATRAGACAYIFGGRHMETRLTASDLIIQLCWKVLGEI